MILAIDWDRTIHDTDRPIEGRKLGAPVPGAKEALTKFKTAGYKIIIHSCARPKIIRDWMTYFEIPFDYIWGEAPADYGHKPVADLYIDDRGLHFQSWARTLEEVEDRGPYLA